MIGELREKHAAAEKELARLERAKQRLVLPAAEGDQAKQRHLSQINGRITEQRLVIEDLAAAIGQVERQIEALEAEERRAQDLALAERLEGWREAFLEASRECDRLMAQLAEALERRACCAREVMACEPVGLRDVGRLLMPVAVARGALAAGLGAHLPLTHPWHDRKHWGRLWDPDALPEVDRVIERLRGESAREAA